MSFGVVLFLGLKFAEGLESWVDGLLGDCVP